MAGYDVVADVRSTLATYLRTELATRLGAAKPVTVMEEWPDPRHDLPERAVTVLAPEQEPDIKFHPPVEWEPPTPSAPGSPTGTVRYSWGRFGVAVQIDLWAHFPDALRELVAACDDALHRHPQLTLPGGDGKPRPGRWHELALAAATLPGAVVYYRLAPAQPPIESVSTSQAREYRMTWTGSAQGLLTTEESCSILRSVTVTQTVGESDDRPAETFTVE